MPYEIVKLPKSNKYMVYNKITKKVYSYHTSRDNAIKQVNMLHLIKGDGIFSTAWDKINDVSKKLIHGRNSLPPRVENILKNYGDAVISGIKIGRTPVPSLITGILKIVSSTPYEAGVNLISTKKSLSRKINYELMENLVRSIIFTK